MGVNRGGRWVRETLTPYPLAQRIEIRGIGNLAQPGGDALEDEVAQRLAVLLFADQLAHVFTAGAVTPPGNLLVDEFLHRVGRRNVLRAQDGQVAGLANFGKLVRLFMLVAFERHVLESSDRRRWHVGYIANMTSRM